MDKDAITDDTYEEIVGSCKEPHFVEFFATWCGHCQKMAPVISELASEYEGKIKFFLVDVDRARKTCDKLDVVGTPTMFFYKAAEEKAHKKRIGEQEIDDMREFLDEII